MAIPSLVTNGPKTGPYSVTSQRMGNIGMALYPTKAEERVEDDEIYERWTDGGELSSESDTPEQFVNGSIRPPRSISLPNLKISAFKIREGGTQGSSINLLGIHSWDRPIHLLQRTLNLSSQLSFESALWSALLPGWVDHWALNVGDTCFELSRMGGVHLVTSGYGQVRHRFKRSMYLGYAYWSDEEIKRCCDAALKKRPVYHLFWANCQTLIQVCLSTEGLKNSENAAKKLPDGLLPGLLISAGSRFCNAGCLYFLFDGVYHLLYSSLPTWHLILNSISVCVLIIMSLGCSVLIAERFQECLEEATTYEKIASGERDLR